MLQGHSRGMSVHGIRSCFLMCKRLTLQRNQRSVVTHPDTKRLLQCKMTDVRLGGRHTDRHVTAVPRLPVSTEAAWRS